MSSMNMQDLNTATSNPPQQEQGVHGAGGARTGTQGAQPTCSSTSPTTTTGEDSSSGQDPRQCWICGKTFARKSAVWTHVNTHTGEKPFFCRAPGCPAQFAARSNMLRHRRSTHGEAVAKALEQQDKDEAAARGPPPAIFNPPIVNEQVGEGSSRPMNVQWMVPNRATRPYTRYPDIPRTTEDAAVPMAAPTTYSSGAMYTPTWQSMAPSEPTQDSGSQATNEG